MAESAEARKARSARRKQRMLVDPEYAAEQRASAKAAKQRYDQKKRMTAGIIGSGKPGRIVARIGWVGW